MQGPLKAVKIRVVGIVQGVGFRPFVYRLARSLGLRGYVVNLGGSEVEIHIEGPLPNVLEFIDRLKRDKPPRAKILNLFLEDVEVQEFREFMILDSLRLTTFRSVIPPDIAICDECVKEILNPQSRFYRYPWNSCVWCGPRFSMMYTVPYDRRNTAMRDFKLCDKCLRSYTDSRRSKEVSWSGH
uniref:acylphosphatase n=1 Tax=Ignisphaera aggregans TaxID=334771 RepID=A0A7C2Z8U4_9CREN